MTEVPFVFFAGTWHHLSELIKADQLNNISSSSKKLQQTHRCSDINFLIFCSKKHLLRLTLVIITFSNTCYNCINNGKDFLLVLSFWTLATMTKDSLKTRQLPLTVLVVTDQLYNLNSSRTVSSKIESRHF